MKLTRAVMALVGLAFSAPCQIPDFTPPTPLIGAIVRNDTAATEKLLSSGADPNQGRFLGATPLILALMQTNVPLAKSLLDKGADPKGVDGAGNTTLMWAATSETADITLAPQLLKAGVDPNAANKMGETALVWAMRRGFSPMTQFLLRSGASDQQLIRQAVEKSLAVLQKSGPEFVKVSGCTSCHHQSLPQMAYGMARQHGISVDAQFSDKQAKSVIAMFKPHRDEMLQGKPSLPDPSISVSYSLIGLGAEGYTPDETTKAMAHLVSTQQTTDGSFTILGARPPMESSAVSATALSIRGLQLYGENPEERIGRGVRWLAQAKARTMEERTMQLLGLVWGKANRDLIRRVATALEAEQRPDGGWSQLPTLESDAYATGQALVALQLANATSASEGSLQKGVVFLLRTQLQDGTWLVRTRTFPFQPSKESGFPHGKDQWISAMGTSWASMALTLTLPTNGEQLSGAF